MAQLTDDCFAFGGDLMRIEDAIDLLRARVSPVPDVERVALMQADGRILAETVAAPVNLPPFRNSAVDGYAVRHADLDAASDTRLPLVGRAAAGRAVEGAPRAGAALRIFTGAPMPEGFDTVFMQEDVREDSGDVVLPAGLKPGANVRAAGEDIAVGEEALKAGQRIAPSHIALAAALGLPVLPVRRRIRIAVFSTGDELSEPGQRLGPQALYDSNRFALAALARRAGAEIVDLGILRDDRETIRRALEQAAPTHDLLLTSGGVSTGEEDHVKFAVEAAGALAFWRLGIKPGRPVAMGVVAGTPFIGLPGNPVAAFVTWAFVARALVAALSGEDWAPPKPMRVTAGFGYKKKAGRREYVRVSLEEKDGVTFARKYHREGAGLITSLTRTQGLVELPEDMLRVEEGDALNFIDYARLG